MERRVCISNEMERMVIPGVGGENACPLLDSYGHNECPWLNSYHQSSCRFLQQRRNTGDDDWKDCLQNRLESSANKIYHIPMMHHRIVII